MDHQCCYDEQDRGRCSVCLPEHGGYEVLVKLGDMGVCVNPAAHNIDTLGVKRFAPECLRFDSKITEKVQVSSVNNYLYINVAIVILTIVLLTIVLLTIVLLAIVILTIVLLTIVLLTIVILTMVVSLSL